MAANNNNFQNPYKDNITDPTGSKEDAINCALKIEDYYHRAGYSWINVKVNTIPLYNGNGDRVGSRYELESNIKFDVNNYLAKSKA